MTTDTAQGTTTTATTTVPTTESTEACSYTPPGYNPPPSDDYFATVGDAPLPAGGTLAVKFRRIRWWKDWTVCNLANSIDEARTPTGERIFTASYVDLDCHPDMKTPLDHFANTVNYFSSQCGAGYGALQTIGHGSGQREQDRCKAYNSYHCEARAVDIYWLEWSGGVVSRPCNGTGEVASSETAHRRLIAIEAGLRKFFGYVLARNISGHHNHFHADNGCPIALRVRSGTTSRTVTSCNYFIQDCVRALVDYGDDRQTAKPAYGGTWDDVSKVGYLRLLSDFGMSELDPVRYVNHYMIFLDFVMMHGFANRAAGAYRWGDVPTL